jgi:hypothetical protein
MLRTVYQRQVAIMLKGVWMVWIPLFVFGLCSKLSGPHDDVIVIMFAPQLRNVLSFLHMYVITPHVIN